MVGTATHNPTHLKGSREDKVDSACAYFFRGIYVAAIIALPLGIGIYASANNGKLGEYNIYRSGYICGTEPPTREDIFARSGIPTCLDIKSIGNQYINDPFCLQAGGLDKPAVWCSEKGPYLTDDGDQDKVYLWWSPCDKCGTAWRIFKTKDDDQSWYKRPTSPQPNNAAIPSKDGWLYWTGLRWRETITMGITTCSSNNEDANHTI